MFPPVYDKLRTPMITVLKLSVALNVFAALAWAYCGYGGLAFMSLFGAVGSWIGARGREA